MGSTRRTAGTKLASLSVTITRSVSPVADRTPHKNATVLEATADRVPRPLTTERLTGAAVTALPAALGDAAHQVCPNFTLPLCTDNVPDPQRYNSTFPYLKPPV